MMTKLFLGLLLIAAVPVTAATPLVYKPFDGPMDFWIRTTESAVREGETTSPAWVESDALELVTQWVTAAEGGKLAVRVQSHGKELRVNGATVEAPASEPFSYEMATTGELAALAADEPAAGLAPVLPATPVEPGHSWTVKVPASEKLGAALEMTHTFEAVETVRGVSCARIVSAGASTEKDPAASFAYALRVSATTYLGLTDGAVVQASTTTSLIARSAKKGAVGPRLMKQLVKRTVQRKQPGDTEAPDR